MIVNWSYITYLPHANLIVSSRLFSELTIYDSNSNFHVCAFSVATFLQWLHHKLMSNKWFNIKYFHKIAKSISMFEKYMRQKNGLEIKPIKKQMDLTFSYKLPELQVSVKRKLNIYIYIYIFEKNPNLHQYPWN